MEVVLFDCRVCISEEFRKVTFINDNQKKEQSIRRVAGQKERNTFEQWKLIRKHIKVTLSVRLSFAQFDFSKNVSFCNGHSIDGKHLTSCSRSTLSVILLIIAVLFIVVIAIGLLGSCVACCFTIYTGRQLFSRKDDNHLVIENGILLRDMNQTSSSRLESNPQFETISTRMHHTFNIRIQ